MVIACMILILKGFRVPEGIQGSWRDTGFLKGFRVPEGIQVPGGIQGS